MMKIFNDVKFNFINVFSIVIVAFIFFFFVWICSNKVSDTNHNIGEIKTALIGVLTYVIGYHYGSSKSSAKKDDTIQAMSKSENTQNPIV